MGAQGGGPDRGRARGPLSSPLVSRAAGAVCEHESYVVQGKQQPTGTPHREDPSQQGESGRYRSAYSRFDSFKNNFLFALVFFFL